ncbi:MAG: hypothetical protein C0423_03210 [Methylibium sp.]|nr:hypothetical protein [Methylibium sp.]
MAVAAAASTQVAQAQDTPCFGSGLLALCHTRSVLAAPSVPAHQAAVQGGQLLLAGFHRMVGRAGMQMALRVVSRGRRLLVVALRVAALLRRPEVIAPMALDQKLLALLLQAMALAATSTTAP